MYHFKIYGEIFIKCIKFRPAQRGKIIYFEQKKNDWLHIHNILSNNVMKAVIASLFIVIVMNILSISFTNAEKPIENYVNIQVHSGDTIWTIAARNVSDKEDIRQLVHAITTMNELNHNSLIYPGQTLKIPATTAFNR